MKLAPILMVCAVLGGCGQPSPVAENAAAPPENMVGDASADGIDAPANSAAAEAAQQAAAPPPTDQMAWHYDAAARIASYGPADVAAVHPQLTFQCLSSIDGGAGGLEVRRADAPANGKGTLSFTGNGHVASLEMTATRQGTAGSTWRGIARGDVMRAIARTFDGPGPVEATIGAAGDLRLAAAPEARAALACRA